MIIKGKQNSREKLGNHNTLSREYYFAVVAIVVVIVGAGVEGCRRYPAFRQGCGNSES